MIWPTGARFVLFVVFGSLFLACSLLNLVTAFLENEKIRRFSKPFCLLDLGLAMVFLVPNHYLIYIGAFLGACGDFFLIYKNKKPMLLTGLLCFLLGHFCYIAEIIVFLAGKGLFEWWSYCYMGLYFVVMLGLTFLPIYDFTKHSVTFTSGGIFYATALISVMAAAIMGSLLGYQHYYYLVTIGAVFFIVSDLILTFTIFKHDIKRRDFYIMITYLTGQALITMGLAMTALVP
jgi:uncharacterized membrane protein YhhN